MNPGAIVDGLTIVGNKAGLELQKAGGRKSSTAQAPITGSAPGANVKIDGESDSRNWSQEFAEQTSLLARETGSPDSLDPASEVEPASSSHSTQGTSQLSSPGSLVKLQSVHELQAQASQPVSEADPSAGRGIQERRLSPRSHSNGSSSSDGPRESKSHTENSHSVASTLTDPSLQYANLPSPSYGLTNLLPAGDEWKSGYGQASRGQGSQVEAGKQSAVGDTVGLAALSKDSATAMGRSNGLSVFDLSVSPVGGVGIGAQSASEFFGLASLHADSENNQRFDVAGSGFASPLNDAALDLAGLSGNDSSDVSLAYVGQGNAPAVGSLNLQTAASSKASIVPPASLSSKAIDGPARRSTVSDESGAARGAEQSARQATSDPGVKISGDAGAPTRVHERAKLDDSASGGSANSTLHGSAPNQPSANSAGHPAVTGTLIAASGSHPLSDSAGLEARATGLGQISGLVPGPGSADAFHNNEGATNNNPFLAMDGGRSAAFEQPSGGANQLTVGHQDPVLVYVELRARADGSGVHASLGVQSTAAGESLEGHLSSLASWMNERNTPVESIRVLGLGSEHAQSGTFHGRGFEANGGTGGSGTGAQSGFGGSGGGSGASEHRPSGGSQELPAMASAVPAGLTDSRGVHMSQVIPVGVNGKSISVVA
jgi:hypothetical protein